MTEAMPPAFAPWAEFYTLIGTSASALTGLVFVVITLVTRNGSNARDGVRAFSTPTVLHFATGLLVSAVALVPLRSLVPASLIIGGLGVYGVVHIMRATAGARRLTNYQADLEDWIAYTVLPMLAYAALAAGALLLVRWPSGAMFVVAASVTLLMFVGIRNAWDLVTYIVGQDSGDGESRLEDRSRLESDRQPRPSRIDVHESRFRDARDGGWVRVPCERPASAVTERERERSCAQRRSKHFWGVDMPDEPTAARETFGDIAPALAGYTDRVLFGDVWRRDGLSPRDRSLITVASLVSLYRTNELPFHVRKALDNGVTRDEIVELITHLAFYSGWPTASSALPIARSVFAERGL